MPVQETRNAENSKLLKRERTKIYLKTAEKRTQSDARRAA